MKQRIWNDVRDLICFTSGSIWYGGDSIYRLNYIMSWGSNTTGE